MGEQIDEHSWSSEPADGRTVGPAARIAAMRNRMNGTEARVAAFLTSRATDAVEMTAQQLAEAAGVARSSVVRTCQALGYRGFPQLRVALATELAQQAPPEVADGDGSLGAMRRSVARVAQLLPGLTGLLDAASVDAAVATIASAPRALILAAGLSSPLGADLAMRLTAAGRPAEFQPDGLAQQISAQTLAPADCAIAISASGSSRSTVAAAAAARTAGAEVVCITSFRDTPLARHGTHRLVVAGGASFREELERTSRVAHAIFLEALVEAFVDSRGDAGQAARSRALDAVGGHLIDDPDS
ncbi:MurR/RpiR family transcriptional regulator [Microbacterium sp. LRZ72]|uniref:MurR/RpiR family transcriptional regulator n=1 Tax=Microbacterium sp. LRZ72 TaxID=2942481 RepID=UPI0029A48534|nr:MurR/RpiR family transcriptional regulator [Microbacterium sp. LRZ72]MDX2376010.1 MurR/RpiR family transcriptional regulator [Microbacterium sp. LRZ72]